MGRDTVTGFAAELRRLREAAGWTIDELADRSGVNRSSIAKLERNERAPSLRVALQLADALGASVYDMRAQGAQPAGENQAAAGGDGARRAKPAKLKEPKEGELQGVGVFRANEAINCLSRIPKNDALRKRGFQIVTDWIRRNK